MEYQETINALLITLLAVVGLPLAAHLFATLSTFLRAKATEIKDKRCRELVQQAITIVEQAVLYVMQTYVDSLKASGNFGIEAQKSALVTARAKAKALIGAEMVSAIEESYGAFDTWLDTRIEQTVRENKK